MSYSITTEPAQHHFTASPDESLLDAALRAGIHLPYGCRNGQCGSCSVEVLEGEVAYPQAPPALLKTPPAQIGLSCQAQARSPLRIRVSELDAATNLPLRCLPGRVEEKTLLNHDVLRLRLKLPEGQRLRFLAGQYLEFIEPDGQRRAFSIANAPHRDRLIELHIRRVAGGRFTAKLFEQLPLRSILRLRAPLGRFILRESDRPRLFVAGGTGFAPIKAMLEQLFDQPLTQPVTLYWGARSSADLYLHDLVRQWQHDQPQFRWVPVLSDPEPTWTGRCGWVHQAVLADFAHLADHDVYVSGPPALVKAARAEFAAAGLPLDQLFSDAFEYAAST